MKRAMVDAVAMREGAVSACPQARVHAWARPSGSGRIACLLLAACSGVSASAGADSSGQGCAPGAGYQLLFEDTFSGAQVDQSKWNFRVGPRLGLNIHGMNLQRNVAQKDGLLVIKNDVEVLDNKTENTGGGLISKTNFGYGYYEVRVKPFMGGKGLHSAFWQKGVSESGYQNTIFEIDGFEIDSPHAHTTHNLYIIPNGLGRKELPWPHRANMPVELDAEGWFTVAYDYGPEDIKFFQNGKLVATATYPLEFPALIAQQNVWLTALNGVGPVDKDKQPGYTYFDHFRFCAKSYPGVDILPNGGFEYNQTQVPLQTAIAWRETGDTADSQVMPSADAKSGQYLLRHGAGKPYRVATTQTLQHIRDGQHQLWVWVRTSAGAPAAKVSVLSGGRLWSAVVPQTAAWARLELNDVVVYGNTVTIELDSAGAAGQWVEFDDIRFMAAGGPPVESPQRRHDPAVDPVWRIFERGPVAFNGNDTFYFVDRNVGLGDAISVSMHVNASRLQASRPMMRSPRTGKDGWAVGIDRNGAAYCLIGSTAEHDVVSSPRAYEPGTAVALACVHDRGRLALYVDGQEAASKTVIGFGTNDTQAAGRLGATAAWYDAVGDVTVAGGPGDAPKTGQANFSGRLSHVAVYNRALAPAEIKNLARAR